MASRSKAKLPRMPEAMYDFSILRRLRKRDGLTIDDLSQRTGVSPAVISKLERNRTSAELATLFCISRAFGLNTTDLLMLAESRTSHRTDEKIRRSGAFTFREVRYANVETLVGEARAGGRASNPEIHQDDLEVCWVLRGRVRVTLPHERHVLKAGAAIQFDAILEHTYEVVEDCQLLILHLKKGKRF